MFSLSVFPALRYQRLTARALMTEGYNDVINRAGLPSWHPGRERGPRFLPEMGSAPQQSLIGLAQPEFFPAFVAKPFHGFDIAFEDVGGVGEGGDGAVDAAFAQQVQGRVG